MMQDPRLSLLVFFSLLFSTIALPPYPFGGRGAIRYPYRRAIDFKTITIPSTASEAGAALPEAYVSFSIEFSSWPDFAGNKSNPNTFSDNLLNNLKDLQGTKPYFRVGGNTQDFALYDPQLKVALNGTYIDTVSKDYPAIITIGPSFFESYNTFPDTKFIHGFNLAKNDSVANTSLEQEAAVACKALSNGNFLYWEMGNEPDLFKRTGGVRPENWTEADYVKEWVEKTNQVKSIIVKACGESWGSNSSFQWIAPSFAGTNNSLKTLKTWDAGLKDQKNVIQFCSHNYMGGANQPGVTLAGTLMNHTKVVASVGSHVTEMKQLQSAGLKYDYILGEGNSLYNQGKPGLSNSFGAALWGVDFFLYSASVDIRRFHFHMGTDYRYASWQPIQTDKTTIGTKAPYYGNIAVAAAFGDLTKKNVRVQNIDLQTEKESAYAIYNDNTLKRVMVINMNEYNYTGNSSSRPSDTYNFALPQSCAGAGTVSRLLANGSDSITGVTFNAYSYNYEIDTGKPVLLSNVTKDEATVVGQDGSVAVAVPWSSAALLNVKC